MTVKQDYESVACQLCLLGYRREEPGPVGQILWARVPLLPGYRYTDLYLHRPEVWCRSDSLLPGSTLARGLLEFWGETSFSAISYIWVGERRRWLPSLKNYNFRVTNASAPKFKKSHRLPSPKRAPVPWIPAVSEQ